jgi:hypothetical protein
MDFEIQYTNKDEVDTPFTWDSIEYSVVTLETAKKLKEAGFNLPTHYYYNDGVIPFVSKGLKRVKLGTRRINHNKYDDFIYSAPNKREVILFLKKYKKQISDEEILEKNGWFIVCISPFEIQHEDGSFATLNAAKIILEYLKM